LKNGRSQYPKNLTQGRIYYYILKMLVKIILYHININSAENKTTGTTNKYKAALCNIKHCSGLFPSLQSVSGSYQAATLTSLQATYRHSLHGSSLQQLEANCAFHLHSAPRLVPICHRSLTVITYTNSITKATRSKYPNVRAWETISVCMILSALPASRYCRF
jgi:hypothetical protein